VTDEEMYKQLTRCDSPAQLLDRLRDMTSQWHRACAVQDFQTARATAPGIAEWFRLLDLWLSDGGQLPEQWRPKPELPTMETVLIDMHLANDCCARTIAAQMPDKFVPGTVVRCTSCRSYYRYTLDHTRGGVCVWRWTATDGKRPQSETVCTLREVIDAADARDQDFLVTDDEDSNNQ
jgi:hypothetical protein